MSKQLSREQYFQMYLNDLFNRPRPLMLETSPIRAPLLGSALDASFQKTVLNEHLKLLAEEAKKVKK